MGLVTVCPLCWLPSVSASWRTSSKVAGSAIAEIDVPLYNLSVLAGDFYYYYYFFCNLVGVITQGLMPSIRHGRGSLGSAGKQLQPKGAHQRHCSVHG